MRAVLLLCCLLGAAQACTDLYMNFTDFRLSARTLDLGLMSNWTITSWPTSASLLDEEQQIDNPPLAFWPSKFGALGITANWFGDEHYGFPSLFADSLNERGLSCSLLTLDKTEYQQKSADKTNVFAGLFCFYAVQNYESVHDLQQSLPSIAIWGPDALAQHFVVRDSSGASLVIELVGGMQYVYLDSNDGIGGYGITTNEPTFDFHLTNVAHYEWKRGLARQAVAVPGNFYPEERFLRTHMVRSGMQQMGLMDTHDFQQAFSLTTQVLNTVTVPQGYQWGTDSGSSEGDADHSNWGLVRDHAEPAIYWRDASNPTFRKISLAPLLQGGKRRAMQLESGP
ncbi:nucleophile aminohydrolase, partial [Ochromonadaceae sp. CCMP2298]